MASEETRNTYGRNVDYLAFVVHGIGTSAEDFTKTVQELEVNTVIQRRRLEELYEYKLKAVKQQNNGDSPPAEAELIQGFPKDVRDVQDQFLGDRKGMIKFEPIAWWKDVHLAGEASNFNKRHDRLEPSGKVDSSGGVVAMMRGFARDYIMDVLLYLERRQEILTVVGNKINQAYKDYQKLHGAFRGRILFVGHSLGTIILFDLLANQGSLPLDPSIKVPQLIFNGERQQELFMAAGAPIGMFLNLRYPNGMVPDTFRYFPFVRGFINVMHAWDPVAYRIEPLFDEGDPRAPIDVPSHIARHQLAKARGEGRLNFINIRTWVQTGFWGLFMRQKKAGDEPVEAVQSNAVSDTPQVDQAAEKQDKEEALEIIHNTDCAKNAARQALRLLKYDEKEIESLLEEPNPERWVNQASKKVPLPLFRDELPKPGPFSLNDGRRFDYLINAPPTMHIHTKYLWELDVAHLLLKGLQERRGQPFPVRKG